MTQSRSVCHRIRNARASLDNAEKSFRSNQEVRGELDLMLAEAELENLRQKRSGWISWTRHTLAVCLAVLLLSAGGLGWWWASAYGGNTTNAAGRTVLPMTDDAKKEAEEQRPTGAAVVRESASLEHSSRERNDIKQNSAVQEPVTSSMPQEKRAESVSVTLSPGQMRQLIRSGKQELGKMR